MMKALVIYDSIFGNTEQIAQAMGNALSSQADVEILRADRITVEQLRGVKLLIVGSPTRGFRPTPAISDFLASIPVQGLEGIEIAAFDTRFSLNDIESPLLRILVKLFGYAAKPIADRLKKKGGELIILPEGFLVNGTEGPLKEGELERATDWIKQLLVTHQS